MSAVARAMLAFLAAAAILAASPAAAFKIRAAGPTPLPDEHDAQSLAFMRHFTSAVHERITQKAYDRAEARLPSDVIAGVRWNDNPEGLRTEAISLRATGQAIDAARSHFGDLQFLHAMAAAGGEPARETRDKALRWSEFAYRVARGEQRAAFHGPAKKTWTAQDVFTGISGNVKLVAFGSLLHLVQDAYSASHVRRDSIRVQRNGCASYDAADAVLEFQTYAGQDTEKHELCDEAPEWLFRDRIGSPLDVLAELIRAYDEGREWPAVKAILEDKVFRLADPAASARPGECFALGEDAKTPSRGPPPPPPASLDPLCRQGAVR